MPTYLIHFIVFTALVLRSLAWSTLKCHGHTLYHIMTFLLLGLRRSYRAKIAGTTKSSLCGQASPTTSPEFMSTGTGPFRYSLTWYTSTCPSSQKGLPEVGHPELLGKASRILKVQDAFSSYQKRSIACRIQIPSIGQAFLSRPTDGPKQTRHKPGNQHDANTGRKTSKLAIRITT